jgi:hypothetical protein
MRLSVVRPIETRKFIAVSRQYLHNEEEAIGEQGLGSGLNQRSCLAALGTWRGGSLRHAVGGARGEVVGGPHGVGVGSESDSRDWVPDELVDGLPLVTASPPPTACAANGA